MYIGQVINDLIAEKKIKKKDVLIALNLSSAQLESYIKGNPTVKNLERIADFFDVPVGIFFSRRKDFNNLIENINGGNNNIQQGHINVMQQNADHLKQLLDEKERTIQILMQKK